MYLHCEIEKKSDPKNEFFELGDWKENCCEDGIKCSDVTGLNSEFCNKYEKHYDETKKNSDELFTLQVINAEHTADSQDKSAFVAELCCVDTECLEEICAEEDSELTKEKGDKDSVWYSGLISILLWV